MDTAMRNFVIAAVAIFAFASFVTSAEARSRARSFTDAAEFVQDLKSSGQFEIESSDLALRTSSNDEIKKFAQHMIDDHNAADQKLTDTLKQEKLLGPEYGMDAEGQDLFNQLTVLQGSAFDRAYVRDQIQGHEQAVELLEGYSKRGDNDALKQLASTLLPTIKEHLQRAETLGSSVTARR